MDGCKRRELAEFLRAVSHAINDEIGESLSGESLRRIETRILALGRKLSTPPQQVKVAVDWPSGIVIVGFDVDFERAAKGAIGADTEDASAESPAIPVGAPVHMWSKLDRSTQLEIRKTETGFELLDRRLGAILWIGEGEAEALEVAQLCMATDGAVAN